MVRPPFYTFTPEQRPLVLTGATDFTLRPSGRKAHARVGKRLDLDELDAEGVTHTYATALCVYRARIYFNDAALLRLVHVYVGLDGEPLDLLFTASEQGAYAADRHLPFLARRAGFEAWPTLFAWHKANGPRGKRLMREVIGWTDVQPAAGG